VSGVKTYTKALIPRARAMRTHMTRAEAKLWFEFLRGFVPRVRRQRPVLNFIVDFYCASCKTVIEIDGATHDSEAAQVYDLERTARLEGLGLRVLRFTNRQVFEDFENVVKQLELELR
jgi:very-short-patch-repair endonuclease